MEIEFPILIVRCIPDSKAQDFRLQKKNFLEYQNLDTLHGGVNHQVKQWFFSKQVSKHFIQWEHY